MKKSENHELIRVVSQFSRYIFFITDSVIKIAAKKSLTVYYKMYFLYIVHCTTYCLPFKKNCKYSLALV